MSWLTNKATRILLTVLGPLICQGVNAQTIDNDIYQYATIDSTVAVDANLQLWLFLWGPNDNEFNNVGQVSQNQQIIIAMGDSSYYSNDTLYYSPNFSSLSADTSVTRSWTNTYDNDSDTLSGAIDGLIMKVRVYTTPEDSITEATWGTDSTVLDRGATHSPNPVTDWSASLGNGGQPDSATIVGLDTTEAYWFAIKTRDEAYNWSPISNNVLIGFNQELDSTTIQIYELVTTFNRWDGIQWDSGPIGPITYVEVTLGVVPQGETITVSNDNP
jgi:hypothetical protein